MREINEYDMELYDFACQLVLQRGPVVDDLYEHKLKAGRQADSRFQHLKQRTTYYKLKSLQNLRNAGRMEYRSYETSLKPLFEEMSCTGNTACDFLMTTPMIRECGFFRPPGHKQPTNKNR